MPRLIGDKIKSDVKDFVKQYSKPFDEIYQEAVAEAATITPEELLKMREYVVKTAPLKPEIIYIGGPAISYEISTQTNPMISESGSQTIEGLGTFDDKDFENIVKNNSVEVQMVIPPSADYHSEEEPGKMSAEAEEALKIKLETEVERQNRIKEDMRQALNPKFGLLLDPSYPDHQVLIKKLKNLTEFDLKIFEDSFVQQIDKTLPPPEILTLKWNEKMYKLVTFWTWTSPTIDEKLPIELRRKRVQKNEAAYLYIPPPPPSYPFDRTPPDFTEFECLFPIIKRRFGILEEYPTPPGVKKRRYCQSDEESDNDDKNDIEESSYLTYDQWHKKLASDSNSSFWRDSDEDDDGSSLDSFERFELSCPHRFGRNKKRSRNEGNEGQVTSEAEVVKEKEIIEVPVERVVTPEVTKDVEVEAVEIDEEENGENGENNFDGIESCDEEELWDDFIPERVFAEKCIYTNTYNVVDDFY
uniref:Uncharacterized protein n=1 Tax=Panagrolaimus superbus TaxID=310955 RepID=A0A914Z4M8_9BILA